jgi:hypothetical protein
MSIQTPATFAASLAATIGFILSADAIGADYKAPRNEFGQPDLQGVWTNATITPLERYPEFGDRLIITPAEAKAFEKMFLDVSAADDAPTDPKIRTEDLPEDCGFGFSGADCGYNDFWIDPGRHMFLINGQHRSSIIVEPANGRVPPLTPEGEARVKAQYASYRNWDGPEVRPVGERCLLSFDSSAGPPMLPLLYNNMYQIVQTPDAVMIHVEMVHDTRIVKLDGKRLPSGMKQWMGESVGRWEGETLVIETTKIRKEQLFRGASENMKVTERLTRIAPTQILYRFTIEDPTTFTQPWSGELVFSATKEHMHEYACHEGNYALPGILSGARADEKAAAAKKLK